MLQILSKKIKFNILNFTIVWFFRVSVSRILADFRITFSNFESKIKENLNENKVENNELKYNPAQKKHKYKNLNQINKKQNDGNIDDIDKDIGIWKMTKTNTYSDIKSSGNQIPDLGPSSGGLNDSGDVTLTSLTVAASSPNIQKNKEKEFILYAGERTV